MAERNSDVITIEDCRRAGHCVKGVKEWCDEHQIDFRDFLKNGVHIDRLLPDGYVEQIIARKRARELRGE